MTTRGTDQHGVGLLLAVPLESEIMRATFNVGLLKTVVAAGYFGTYAIAVMASGGDVVKEPEQKTAPATSSLHSSLGVAPETVGQRFKLHTAGARQVSIPFDIHEFSWKIDWEAQQKYCKSLAHLIFKEPSRISFHPRNGAVVASAGANVKPAIDLINQALPDCNQGSSDWWMSKKSYISILEKTPLFLEQSILYASKTYFISMQYRATSGGSNNVVQMSAYALQGKDTCRLKEVLWDEDEAFGAGNEMLLAFIDDRPMFIRFGKYGSDFQATGPRYGRSLQKYIFAEGMDEELYGTWALESPETSDGTPLMGFALVRIWPQHANHLNACVINFES